MKKIILIIATYFFLSPVAFAATWPNCPFGQSNDPYPGLCARYTDADTNGICDYSQLPSGDETIKVITTPTYYVFEITIVILLLYGFSKYLAYLSRQTKNQFLKKFNLRNVRCGMNLILLLSFVITTITSLISLAQLELGWFKPSAINWSWWHIESGLIMIIIYLIHFVERWNYFINFIKTKNL